MESAMIENKYSRWYHSIIEKAKLRVSSTLTESHHIVPVCMGGSNDSSNLVDLTLREHYVCHLLLTRFAEGDAKWKLIWAVHRMAFNGRKIYSRSYELAREMHRKNAAESNSRIKDRDAWKASIKESYNTPGRRENKATTVKKTWLDNPEGMRAIAAANGAKSKDVVTPKWAAIQYEGVTYYGWRRFEKATGVTEYEYKEFYLNGLPLPQRVEKSPEGTYTCPHCLLTARSLTNMKRFHFDNCKLKGGVSL